MESLEAYAALLRRWQGAINLVGPRLTIFGAGIFSTRLSSHAMSGATPTGWTWAAARAFPALCWPLWEHG